MFSPSRHPKILVGSLLILMLLLLSNSCLAVTYEYTYELLDSPGGSTKYQLEVSVTEALYLNYTGKDHNLHYYDFSRFVTPDTLKPIADDLWRIYDNKEDFANGVLMLVHQIPYMESDPQKYPVETIVENQGDCDLFTILAASIMKAGGLEVVLLLLEYKDHMLLGVHLPESPKDARSTVYFYRHEGKKYYVAETTGGNWEKGWRVGECPEILQYGLAKVIPLGNYETESPGQVSSGYHIPDSSTLQISLSAGFTIEQNDVIISGSLSPSFEGENVTLYVSPLGSPSTLLATVVTDYNGEYSYNWQSPSGGIYSVIAKWSGDDDYSSATSNIFRLVVLPSELLLIGIMVIFLIVILLVINLLMREKTPNEGRNYEDWEPTDF